MAENGLPALMHRRRIQGLVCLEETKLSLKAFQPTQAYSQSPPTPNDITQPPDQPQQPQQTYVPVANGRKRKADGAPSSRGVANLTPEQLAKKRANDREAQRAIRERTKNQIESLERRIRELESQQPFQELQNALRIKDHVLQENEELKRRLASVAALVQPWAAGAPGPGGAVGGGAAVTAQQSPLPLPTQSPAPYPQPGPVAYETPQAFPQHNLHPDLRSTSQPSPNTPGAAPAEYKSPVPTSNGWSPAQAPMYQQQLAPAAPTEYNQASDRRAVNFIMNNERQNNALIASPSRPPSSLDQQQQQFVPIWRRLPITTQPTCPLDKLLLDFLADRRQAAAQGASSATVVGPAYPSISSLLNPKRSAKAHPLSQFFTDIMTTFPDLSTLPEQVAVMFIMFLIMRWHVEPTQENYDRLPEWVRPTRSQLEIAHPVWADHLPWPAMRDRIAQAPPNTYPFESFFVPFTTTLSLNWPYDPSHVLLSLIALAAEDGGELGINLAFEDHLRNLDNWSLGSSFRAQYPDLAEGVRIRDP
ncbi:hypothetical protein H2203_008972 [Taxawa tesnikishii (nom. ined.)]|nr:hypothetical protein H2203_008972 [Dothideales sp. JES 119]